MANHMFLYMQEHRSKIAVLMKQQQVCVNIVKQAMLRTQWETLLLIMRHDHAATVIIGRSGHVQVLYRKAKNKLTRF